MKASASLAAAGGFKKKIFAEPGREFRPECWFAFKGGCLDEHVLKRELGVLAKGGFGGIQSMQYGGAWYPLPNKIPYLSPGWHSFMRNLGDECRRLGLSYTMLCCPGWSMFGGPWVPADKQMRDLAFSIVHGARGSSASPSPTSTPPISPTCACCRRRGSTITKDARGMRCGA